MYILGKLVVASLDSLIFRVGAVHKTPFAALHYNKTF